MLTFQQREARVCCWCFCFFFISSEFLVLFCFVTAFSGSHSHKRLPIPLQKPNTFIYLLRAWILLYKILAYTFLLCCSFFIRLLLPTSGTHTACVKDGEDEAENESEKDKETGRGKELRDVCMCSLLLHIFIYYDNLKSWQKFPLFCIWIGLSDESIKKSKEENKKKHCFAAKMEFTLDCA